jgi:hypothetical protein
VQIYLISCYIIKLCVEDLHFWSWKLHLCLFKTVQVLDANNCVSEQLNKQALWENGYICLSCERGHSCGGDKQKKVVGTNWLGHQPDLLHYLETLHTCMFPKSQALVSMNGIPSFRTTTAWKWSLNIQFQSTRNVYNVYRFPLCIQFAKKIMIFDQEDQL